LTPANFWKILTNFKEAESRIQSEENSKQITSKFEGIRHAKSDKSWNIIFDSMKNQDWSTTSFDAQTASKLEDLFVQFTDEHITETRRV
jgi:hypothetical protein